MRRRLALLFGLIAAATPARVAAQPASPEPPPPPRDPSAITLDVGVHGGITGRFGDPQLYRVESRGGFSLGGGAWINPSPRYGLGLEFSHTALGVEHAGPGPLGVIEVTRSLNALWAGFRVDVFRVPGFEGWLGIGPGLVWSTAHASGVRDVSLGAPGHAFACGGGDGPHLGLRGSVGSAIALGGGLHLAPEIVVEGDQIGTDAIGDCVAGPGTVGVFGFRLGFFVRSDVSRGVR